MASGVPSLEIALAGIASGSLVTLFLLPPTSLLAPELHPWAALLSAGWSLWRLAALERALARRRRWAVSPDWCLDVARLPRGRGLLLGKGFRWNATHVQQLETALVEEGSLPTAETSRGGSPALHAVGMGEEQLVRLPETEMVGHMGILGTTRSGKTSLMKLLTVQAIGG